jgi:hypothetical protein
VVETPGTQDEALPGLNWVSEKLDISGIFLTQFSA